MGWGSVEDVDGWETRQRQTNEGAVESEQRAALSAPVVGFSEAGAAQLGRAYWREVERVTARLVRTRERTGAIGLHVLGRGPALLRFGAPTLEATDARATCRYAIEGGLLAQRPAGEILFEQVGGDAPFVRSAIRGFFPRLAARQGRPDWTGAIYNRVQSRIHVAVSRRYFSRLIAEAGR